MMLHALVHAARVERGKERRKNISYELAAMRYDKYDRGIEITVEMII